MVEGGVGVCVGGLAALVDAKAKLRKMDRVYIYSSDIWCSQVKIPPSLSCGYFAAEAHDVLLHLEANFEREITHI